MAVPQRKGRICALPLWNCPCSSLIFLSRKLIIRPESDILQKFERCILKENWRALFACLFLVGFVAFVIFATTNSRFSKTCACPMQGIWMYQYGQASLQHSHDEFSLKEIDITSQEFHFFYAYTFSHPGFPSITTTSNLEGSSALPLPLETRVQPLGVLGTVSVGVIHARLFNRVNQSIELHISPPGDSTQHWKLAPLKQSINDPHPGGFIDSFSDLHPPGIPTITFNVPITTGQVAYFRLIQPAHSTSQPVYIFLKMDQPTLVSLITKEQFLAIAGPGNLQP